MNVPLPAGAGDAEYVGVLQRVFAPVVRGFRPELILVSAGFDAHRDDPLAAMNVSRDGFAALSAIVRALADDVCGGRAAFVLEGGYSASGLEQGVGALLGACLCETPGAARPGARPARIAARTGGRAAGGDPRRALPGSRRRLRPAAAHRARPRRLRAEAQHLGVRPASPPKMLWVKFFFADR